MKHLRQRTKTQRANAAILSILTVLSPLQVFGSVLAPIDLGEYFFEVYATAQKPAFSGPVESRANLWNPRGSQVGFGKIFS